MLKTMRNSFHQLKWTLFAVIAVFILGFVFWSGSGNSADPAGQIVAQVGHERITAVDFDQEYKRQVERYRQMYQGNFSPELERALDLPRNVLDSMIEKILRLEAAKRYELRVSDDELAKKIVSLPPFQENGAFIGREKYEKLLRANSLSPERFEEELREDMAARFRWSRFGLWTAPLIVGSATALLLGVGFVLALRGTLGEPLGEPPPAPRDSAAALPSGPKGTTRILVLGDSLAKGTGDETGKGFAVGVLEAFRKNGPAELTNLGVNGMESPEVLAVANTSNVRALAKAASLILLSAGGNDLSHGATGARGTNAGAPAGMPVSDSASRRAAIADRRRS